MQIDWASIGDFCEAVIQIGGAWALLAGLAIIVFRYIRKIPIFIKDMFLAPIRVKHVMDELKNNGGSSLKDAIHRIENRQISNEQKLIHVLDSSEETGSFETDAKGMCIRVSAGYCHLLGRNEEESVGSGWINWVHEDDKDNVWEEWQESVLNKRRFSLTYTVVRNGEPIRIFCRAYPLISPQKETLGWFGIIKRAG